MLKLNLWKLLLDLKSIASDILRYIFEPAEWIRYIAIYFNLPSEYDTWPADKPPIYLQKSFISSKYMSQKRICFCEQSVYAESPLPVIKKMSVCPQRRDTMCHWHMCDMYVSMSHREGEDHQQSTLVSAVFPLEIALPTNHPSTATCPRRRRRGGEPRWNPLCSFLSSLSSPPARPAPPALSLLLVSFYDEKFFW